MATRRHHFKLQTILASSLLIICSVLQPAHADTYEVTDLGVNFYPLSISDTGLVVGIDTLTGNSNSKAMLHDGTSLITLDSQAQATTVSDHGLIAGHQINTPNPNSAILWQGTQASAELNQFSNLTEARGVNAFDEITGQRLVDGQYRRPFFYDITAGTLTTLGTLGGAEAWGNSINDLSSIVGASLDNAGNTIAFRNDISSGMSSLGTIDGYNNSEALNIDDQNSAVGYAYTSKEDHSGKRAIYILPNQAIRNLGTINHDTDSIAKDSNNLGVIIGQSIRANGDSRAFLYDTAVIDTLIVQSDPLFPKTIYIGSINGGGLFKSTDRGAQWTAINRGLTNLNIQEILINPSSNNIIYVSTDDGIFKSTDSGDSWTEISTGIEDITVYTLHFMKPKPAEGSNYDRIFAGSSIGIFFSADAGANWSIVDVDNNTAFAAFDFATHNTKLDYIFAATTRGIYMSSDRGTTWNLQNGDEQSNTDLSVRATTTIETDPNVDDVLYVGTSGGGVYEGRKLLSTIEWKRISTGIISQNVADLVIDGHKGSPPSTLYASTGSGLVSKLSTDEGWTTLSNLGKRSIYSLDIADEGTNVSLYATTLDGDIQRSDNQNGTIGLGINWTSISRGVSTADTYAFTSIADDPTDPNDSKLIFSGNSSGISKLTGNSTDWTSPEGGASGFKITAITAYDANTLWAGSPDQGIYISFDGGKFWNQSNINLNNWSVYALAVDKTASPTTVYAGTLGGVYRSSSGSWALASNNLGNTSVYSLAIDTSVSPTLIFAGTGDGIYRSSDNGDNWAPLDIGVSGIAISSLEIDTTTSPTTIYAASLTNGLFRSSDNGLNWTNMNAGLADSNIFDISLDTTTTPAPKSKYLYVGTTTGVHQLTDPDTCVPACSWTAVNTDIETFSTFAIEVDPDDPTILYAGIADNGVYRSTNSGVTWGPLNNGLPTNINPIQNLNSLTAKPAGDNWTLRDATSINNSGQIVGWGDFGGGKHGYLLTPAIGASSADLKVQLSSSPEILKKGIPMTYHIEVTNLGPHTATGVRLSNWLPKSILYRNASSSSGGCIKNDDDVIRCFLGDIPLGETAYVSISIEPIDANIQLRNIVRANGNESDPDLSNNTAGKNSSTSIDRCFIATAAYGSFLHPHVTELRAFRDEYLLTNYIGQQFVAMYYHYSPPLADMIAGNENLRLMTRIALMPVVYAVIHPLWFTLALLLLGWMVYRRRLHRLAAATVIRNAADY